MGMESTPEVKLVEVVVARIVLRDSARGQHVYLRERDGARGFTLVIGAWEAEEIRRVLAREEAPRPMTHQLALALVRALGGRVVRCDIVDFREHTFFAQLAVESLDRKTLALIDSRPSDGIAIALRAGAPVRATTRWSQATSHSRSMWRAIQRTPGCRPPTARQPCWSRRVQSS